MSMKTLLTGAGIDFTGAGKALPAAFSARLLNAILARPGRRAASPGPRFFAPESLCSVSACLPTAGFAY